VTFGTEAAVTAALAYDQTDLDGCRLTVRPYNKRGQKKESRNVPSDGAHGNRSLDARIVQGEYTDGYNVIFVGNLPNLPHEEVVTDVGLLEHFQKGGCNATRARIHRDESGKCRGFAHVHFKNADSTFKAVNTLNNTLCLGRMIKVTFAKPPANFEIRRNYNT